MRFVKLYPSLVIVAIAAGTRIAGAQTPAPAPSEAGGSSTLPVAFSGEVRQRSDWDRPTGTSADLITYLRSRLGVRATPAAGLSLFVQVQDSRVYGAESNSTATAPDQLEVHQGYLQLDGKRGRDALSLRAGRQEIAFGNERLVGASNWTNTGRAFDGVLATATTGPRWNASAFAATVDERGRRVGAPGPAGNRNDHEVLGAYATHSLAGSTIIDATALYDVGAQYRSYDRSNRATGDLRLRANALGPARLELEGAYQLGTQRFAPVAGAALGQHVDAWLLGARLGTRVRPNGSLSATLGLDALSGDASPGDTRYTAFSTMYATNHPFYGLLDLFTDPAARTNDRGLVDAFANSTWQIDPSYGLRAELHRFSAEAQGVGQSSGPFGWEGDLTLPYKVSAFVTVEGGYSLFRAGTGAAGTTLGSAGQVHHWVYLQLRAGF